MAQRHTQHALYAPAVSPNSTGARAPRCAAKDGRGEGKEGGRERLQSPQQREGKEKLEGKRNAKHLLTLLVLPTPSFFRPSSLLLVVTAASCGCGGSLILPVVVNRLRQLCSVDEREAIRPAHGLRVFFGFWHLKD